MFCLVALAGCQSPKAQTAGPPPAVPVTVATATQESAPLEVRAIGTVEPSAIVQVKSQISGELLSVHFVEGSNVNKGDLLFKIDPRPYEEALRQAEAAVQRDTAQLRQAEANLSRDMAQEKFALAESSRYAALLKEGVISKSQADQFQSNADALHGSVRADQAAIESARASEQSDRAAIDRAKLDLSRCEIRSPLSGRLGNLLVHPGNLVTANSADPLVVIHQITPIFVSFGVPEDQLSAIRSRSANHKLAVQASLRDDVSKAANGTLTVIDNTVDPKTGTIRLKATFDNQERVLWPGQFVNVSLTLDTRNNAVMVPAEAVQAGQNSQFVYVVKPDKTVESRVVTVGSTVRGKVIIEKGVAPGETVVTDGQLRLFPGARIEPVTAGKANPQAQ